MGPRDLIDCIWIVRLYLDCAIVFGLYNCGIWHRGCSITCTPPVPKICAKKDLIDCIQIVSIAFGLCRLHVDCLDCLWINTRPEDDLQTPSSRVKERSERDGGVQRSASGLVLPWPLARIWPLALHRLGLSLSQNVFSAQFYLLTRFAILGPPTLSKMYQRPKGV